MTTRIKLPMLPTAIPGVLALAIALSITGGPARAAQQSIVDTAVKADGFKTLVAAVKAAGLVETLQGEGPFTVFAPTDEAFAKLPEGTVESLLKPENKDKLVDILTYHVVSGSIPASVAVNLDKATALNGKLIRVTKRDDGLFLNDSKVVKTDIACTNGVIHVIDAVLLPPDRKAQMSHDARQLIHLAIERGAPLYNQGNHAACASIYEVTARGLLAMPEDAVSKADRMRLKSALAKAAKSHDMDANAWTFRNAFDQMMMAAQ